MCRFFAPAILTTLVVLAPAASAQTYTWDGGLSHSNFTVNNLWSTPNNWVGGVAPVSAATTDLVFTQSGSWTTADQNITDPFLLHSITFDAANTNFTALTDGPLQFYANVTSPFITQNSAIAITINNAISLTTGLVIQGMGTGSLTLTGAVSGPGILILGTTGTTVLSGNNSYTKGTTFELGITQVGSAGALGTTGTLTFNGGTLQYSLSNAVDYSGRFSALGGQSFFIDTNGQNVTFGSVLQGAGSLLKKLGAGTLTLANGANSYDGGTSIQGGVVRLGANALSSGPVTLANTSGVALDLNGFSATVNSLSGGGVNGGNVLTGGGTLTAGGDNTSTAFGGTITGGGTLSKLGTGTLTLTATGNSVGNLAVTSGSLTVGGGTLGLTSTVLPLSVGSASAAATFTVSGGAVVTSSDTSLGAIWQIDGLTAAAVVTGTGSRVNVARLINVGQETSGSLTVQNGASATAADAVQVGVHSGSAGTLLIQSGGMVSTGATDLAVSQGATGIVTVIGAGSTLSTGNIYLGTNGLGTNGGTGQLLVGPGGAVTVAGTMLLFTSASLVNVNGGTLSVGSLASSAGATPAVQTSDLSSGAALTIGSDNTSTTFSGSIADAAAGPGTVNKVGAGMLTLTGYLTNTGGYAATSGTLEFSGAVIQPGPGTLTAAAGATIQFDSGTRMLGGYLRGTGTFTLSGMATLSGVTTFNSTVVNVIAAGSFVNFTNGGALAVSAGASGPATFNGFTNNGSGSITIGANGQVNATDFETYGLLTLTNGTGSTITLLTNTGTTPLFFNGGSRTFISTSATAGTFTVGIDLHGQNAIVAGGLFVNNGYVIDSTNSGAVVVADYGALVKGAGFYLNSPITQNGGRVQAGNSPGSASFGQLTFGPGGVSNYLFAIDDATGTAGPTPNASGQVSGWGLMKSVQRQIGSMTTSGDFAWTADSTNKLDFAIETLVNPTTAGTDVTGLMADFDPSRSYAWPAVTWSGVYSGPTDVAALDADTIFDTTRFENPLAGTFGWSLDTTGQSLSLTYTPSSVPEPGTLLLSAAAGLGLLKVGRRRTLFGIR